MMPTTGAGSDWFAGDVDCDGNELGTIRVDEMSRLAEAAITLRTEIFAALRRHDVSEDCFAAVASVLTHSAPDAKSVSQLSSELPTDDNRLLVEADLAKTPDAANLSALYGYDAGLAEGAAQLAAERAKITALEAQPFGLSRTRMAELLYEHEGFVDVARSNNAPDRGVPEWIEREISLNIHSGDCTGQCHSCMRCHANDALEQWDQFVAMAARAMIERMK